MIRKPDYERGRFFISPILGCNAQCRFCYIYEKGYETKAVKNKFDISQVLEYLHSHSDFKSGKHGTIISIGAWGDPFPKYNKELCLHSLHWLKELSFLDNPIQIMSRYELRTDIIDGIIEANHYAGHILYSTSISSIEHFRKIEPYADMPENRLRSLKLLKESGITTNVMVKPFILGITDLEAIEIANTLKKYEVEQCVVGDLLLDSRIKKELFDIGLPISVKNEDRQVLDCTSGESYELSSSNEAIVFSNVLSDLGIKVFRKSSCVNSYVLNIPNPANYIQSDPNKYCIKCGACK